MLRLVAVVDLELKQMDLKNYDAVRTVGKGFIEMVSENLICKMRNL